MALTAKIGTGATLSFTGFSTGNNLGIIGIDGPDQKLGYEDANKMTTTSAQDFLPHTLVDGGEVKVSHEWDGLTIPSMGSTSNIKTLTLATSTGGGGSASAFIIGFSPKYPLEGKMTAETTFKITGAWTTST